MCIILPADKEQGTSSRFPVSYSRCPVPDYIVLSNCFLGPLLQFFQINMLFVVFSNKEQGTSSRFPVPIPDSEFPIILSFRLLLTKLNSLY